MKPGDIVKIGEPYYFNGRCSWVPSMDWYSGKVVVLTTVTPYKVFIEGYPFSFPIESIQKITRRWR